MDNTPPNQRRLTENNALEELIQATEHMEDSPTWGQRDYQLFSPRYGDPFYRGKGRGRGRGRRDWLSERSFERESNAGFGRGFFCGNGRGAIRESFQTTSEREQRDRQEEEWSILASVERRNDSPARQETPQRTPPTPVPSEDRPFTNWSSLESPCVRTPPQSVPIRETGLEINQPINQTTQPGSEIAQKGAKGNALCDDINVSPPKTHQQLDELGVRMMDIGTNTFDVEE